MATKIVVNSDAWPVNIITVDTGGEPIDRAGAEALCNVLESFPARRAPFANIIDLSRCGSAMSTERRLVAERFNAHEAAYRAHLVAVAVIVPSKLLRGALTAIGWVHRYPAPIEFVDSVETAAAKLLPHLAARGITWAGLPKPSARGTV